MRFTVGWLKDYLNFDCSLEHLCEKLTSIGLEVEKVRRPINDPLKFIISIVKKVEKHPNADKLKICTVFDGKNEYQIICGAENVKEDLITVLAKEGALIHVGTDNEFKISKSKIRGVESNGMLCSEEELGLNEKSDGIVELDSSHLVGKSFSDYLSDEDVELEIAITPNRVDCAGVYGVARDLCAAGLGNLKKIKINDFKSTIDSKIKIKNHLREKECPVFMLREIKNLTNGLSPRWMQKRFNMTGLKIISGLVDITNYINIDFCRPLHVFDADKVEGEITIRHSIKGEKFFGLDDEEYILEDGMMVICDEKKIISLAGVLGGKNTACETNTKNIIIESAYFLPDSISATGRKLNIQSDARYRFERGIDPLSTEDGINYATKMITEYYGGEVGNIIQDNGFIKETEKINISSEFVNKILGTNLTEKIIIEKLLKIGCLIEKKNNDLNVLPPSWRQDISLKEDLIEEVARLYGYDLIQNEPMILKTKSSDVTDIFQKAKKKIKESLVSRDIAEVINWSFVNTEWEKIFNNHDPIEIENPISSELSVLRSNLIGGLLSVLKKNNNNGIKNISMFEIGPVFFQKESIHQTDHVVVLRSGKISDKNWVEKDRDFDVFDIKEDLISIFKVLGFDERNIKYINKSQDFYHPGKSCTVKFGNKSIASFGEIHPSIKKFFNLKNNIYVFELNFTVLASFLKKKPTSKIEFLKLPFQSSVRDFSFNIDTKLSSGEIIDFIYSIDKGLIKTVKIFDNYDDQVSGRSVGIEVKIQSNKKTLDEQEINNLTNKIIEEVQKKFDAKLR